jgi:UDP-N-acetylglucosamine--N-acetylmuramyl-(pentapeptide) pyrophosphoryl-undecaprenol N-acetylglucosamine transferase
VGRQGITYRASRPPVCMALVWSKCRQPPQTGRGVLAARRILLEFKPDVLFFTGGYVAVPVALAGQPIPTMLYVPDIEPGHGAEIPGALCGRDRGDNGGIAAVL